MISAGEKAPDFSGALADGRQFRLSEWRGKRHLIVYFFPKDFTPGCTKEACEFRDRRADIQALDAEIVGISLDSAEKHGEFAEAYNLPYPLVADPDAKIAAAFGVARFGGWLPSKRATFVIGKDGIVKHVIQSELNINKHIDEALAALKTLHGI